MNVPWPIPLQTAVLPKEVTGRIKEIVRSFVGGDVAPRFIEVVPLEFCATQDCHPNVEQAVRRLGGRPQSGWAVNRVPGEYYEFVAHSIWIRPDHRWVDITPEAGTPRRLFVPDGSVNYDGSRPIPTTFFADTNSGDCGVRVARMNRLAKRVSLCLAASDELNGNVAHAELSRLVAACIQRSARRGWGP